MEAIFAPLVVERPAAKERPLQCRTCGSLNFGLQPGGRFTKLRGHQGKLDCAAALDRRMQCFIVVTTSPGHAWRALGQEMLGCARTRCSVAFTARR